MEVLKVEVREGSWKRQSALGALKRALATAKGALCPPNRQKQGGGQGKTETRRAAGRAGMLPGPASL